MSHIPNERLSHAGAAAEATLATTPTLFATDLTITLSTAAGWPDGTDGPFYVVLDPGGGEEKVRVTSRTGNVLTVQDTTDRGVDGTVAQDHSAGVVVRHCISAAEVDEANDLVHQLLGQISGKGQLPVSKGPALLGLLTSPQDGNTYAVVTDDSAETGFGLSEFVSPGDVAGLATGIATLTSEVDAITNELAADDAAWTSFSPSWNGGCFTPGNGTVRARMKTIGKLRFIRVYVKFGSTSVITSADLVMDLPDGAITDPWFIGCARFGDDSANTVYMGHAFIASPSLLSLEYAKADATLGQVFGGGSGMPFVWAVNDTFAFDIWYELA